MKGSDNPVCILYLWKPLFDQYRDILFFRTAVVLLRSASQQPREPVVDVRNDVVRRDTIICDAQKGSELRRAGWCHAEPLCLRSHTGTTSLSSSAMTIALTHRLLVTSCPKAASSAFDYEREFLGIAVLDNVEIGLYTVVQLAQTLSRVDVEKTMTPPYPSHERQIRFPSIFTQTSRLWTL